MGVLKHKNVILSSIISRYRSAIISATGSLEPWFLEVPMDPNPQYIGEGAV